MFCPKCGKEMPNTAMFCGNCGHKFEKSGNRKRISAKSKKFVRMFVIAVLGCFLCVSILVYSSLLHKGSDSEDSNVGDFHPEELTITEEPTVTEEPEPLHSFELEKDAAFWYEYDAEGELLKLRLRGYIRSFIDCYLTRENNKGNLLFQITNAEYAEDGHLVSLSAVKEKSISETYESIEIYVEAQYSQDGRIANVKITSHGKTTNSANIKLAYNDTTGGIKAVCSEEFSILRGMEAELDGFLDITYSRVTYGEWAGWVGSEYFEYYGNDVVAKVIYYDKKSGEIGMIDTYYDNGQMSEYWQYGSGGKIDFHGQFDRSGNKL